MPISAKQMQLRLQKVADYSFLKQKVNEIVKSDNDVLKAEKIDEWEQGLRPDGTKIGVYKDAEYAIFKDHINPRADGYVDLLLSRQTAKSLFVVPFGDGYLFKINDRHNLVRKYGLDILGLNQKYFNKRQKDIYRLVLIKEIQKTLNA